MKGINIGEYTYTPDMKTFNMDGNHSIVMIILSIIVSPIRLVIRVMHNIAILPANLHKSFYKELLVISSILSVIGFIDFLFYKHWVILLSQVPIIVKSFSKIKSLKDFEIEDVESQEITIDTLAVKEECESVYDEIESKLLDIKQQEVSVDNIISAVEKEEQSHRSDNESGVPSLRDSASRSSLQNSDIIRRRLEERRRSPRSLMDNL